MAACLLGCIPRFSLASGYMQDVFHWLPYSQCIVYHISALFQHCRAGLALSDLREFCCPTVTIQRCVSLRFSAQAELLVPARELLSDNAFSVAGRKSWNSLPVVLHLTLCFIFSGLKTILFDRGWTSRRSLE